MSERWEYLFQELFVGGYVISIENRWLAVPITVEGKLHLLESLSECIVGFAGNKIANADLAFLVGDCQKASKYPNTINSCNMFCNLV